MRRRSVLERGRAPLAALCALFSTLVLAGSCSDLGDFTLGICGNSVLETGEDCEPGDANANPAKVGYCAPKGDANECHYLCAKAGCPTGEFCGVDQVCRAPASGFSLAGQPVSSAARDIRVGDFDGDGRADVLIARRDGAIDLHFPQGRELGVPTSLPADATEGVAIGYLNHDKGAAGTPTASARERTDLVVGSGAALGALLGDSTRKLTVAAVSSYSFPTPAAILAAPSQAFALPTGAPASEALQPDTEVEGVSYDLTPNDFKVLLKGPYGAGTPPLGGLKNVGTFKISSADLSPVNSHGALVDNTMDRPVPCDETVLTAPIDGAAFVVYGCGPNGTPSTAADDPTPAVKITVPAGVTVVGPAIVVDLVNLTTHTAGSDGHLDVALPVESGGVAGLYVAPGNGSLAYPGADSNNFVVASNYSSFGGIATQHLGIIANEGVFAIRDLNADGILDLVTQKGVELSTTVSATSPNGFYQAAFPSLIPWAEAVVADVNNDGRLDVIGAPAGARQGMDVLYGSGQSYFNPSVLSTSNPIGLLTVGDYDGDLVSDIVARAATPNPTSSCDVQDEIVAFFGRTSGGLEEGRVVGRISGAHQLISGRLPRLDRRDSISDFGVASKCGGDSYRVSVFYGTSDRLLDAPYLLTDQFIDNSGDLATYVPNAIAAPSGKLGATPGDTVTLAAIASFDNLGGDFKKPTSVSEMFIETSDLTTLFKQQSVVELEPITQAQAETAALAVGSFGPSSNAQVVVWLAGDDAGPARVGVVSKFDCTRTGGPPLPGSCSTADPVMPVKPATVTPVAFPTNPNVESVQKSQILVGDLDGDGQDDLVFVIVSADGQGGLFFGKNVTSPTASEPSFEIKQIAGVAPTSAAILAQVSSANPAGPSVVFAGSFANGGATETGLFSIAFAKGAAAAPTLIQGTEGACDAGCDSTSSVGTGDVDGDGLDDIVLLVANSVHVYFRDTLLAGTAAAATKGAAK